MHLPLEKADFLLIPACSDAASPTFPHMYGDSPAISSGNERSHRRNESSWTVTSSSARSTSQTGTTYSTQPSEISAEDAQNGSSSCTTLEKADKGKQREVDGQIPIEAGSVPANAQDGNGSSGPFMRRELSSSTETPGSYALAILSGTQHAEGDDHTDRLGSIAPTVESFATAPSSFDHFSRRPLESDASSESPVASTSQSQMPALRSPSSPAPPPGMKISQWLKQQYDAGVRAPELPVKPPLSANPTAAPLPSPKQDPNAPFGSLIKTPNSPGAQHREQILTRIIANDFVGGNGRIAGAPSTDELEQLPWHPSEHVSPIRNSRSSGLKRNWSTGSAFGLGAGSKRNSRFSGLKIDTGSSEPATGVARPRNHQRTLSDDGLSRFRPGKLRSPLSSLAVFGSRQRDSMYVPSNDHDIPEPGMHAYEESPPHTGDGTENNLEKWKRMKAWGRVSMNDLLLKREERSAVTSSPRSGAAPFTPSPRAEFDRPVSSAATMTSPARASHLYEENPLRRHKRSISSVATSLFSRPSLSSASPTRWGSRRREQSAGSTPSSPLVSGTRGPYTISDPIPISTDGLPKAKAPMHARTVSEPFLDSPTLKTRMPLFPSTANSSSSSVNEVHHGHSRPTSPLSRANLAAMMEGQSIPQTSQEEVTQQLSPVGEGYAAVKQMQSKQNGHQRGPKLSDLASQQVARDAELRSKLISRFKPSAPAVPEEVASEVSPPATAVPA